MGVTSWSSYGNTAYVNIGTAKAVTVSESSIALSSIMPSISLRINVSASFSGTRYLYFGSPILYKGSTYIDSIGATTSARVANNAYGTATINNGSRVIYTGNLFDSTNKNSRSVSLTLTGTGVTYVQTEDTGSGYYSADTENTVNFGTVSVITLNAPPTFKTRNASDVETNSVYIDTAYIYTGLTTASIKVSDLSAKYGGDITDVTFTIGSTSVSRTNAGELSILLDTVGTFTPTVTVTDSRGQTTTKTLDAITVNGYVAPSVSFTADRTLASGVPDDEGTYATIDATLTFTDVVADAVAPSVVLTDENGTQTTPSVTWYSSRAADGTLSGALSDWSTLSSGDTVYGLIPNVNTQYSYQISVRPRDSQGTGTAITQTLSSAFYTVDFLAGGHGIAFGQPASDPGFECAMTALFEDDATFGADVLIDLPDYQTAGTTDKSIYDAIVSLGWDSDVIV